MTTFAVPSFGSTRGQRSLYAVVTADVALDELRSYLRRLRLGESGFATLLSRTGIIISGRDPSNICATIRKHCRPAGPGHLARNVSVGTCGQAVTRQLECPEITGGCVIRMDALQSTGWPVGVVYSEREMTRAAA